MVIGKFRHKGLRRLYEDDNLSGVPAEYVRKLKAILAALEFADNLAQVATMPGWKLHPLRGDRKDQLQHRRNGQLADYFQTSRKYRHRREL